MGHYGLSGDTSSGELNADGGVREEQHPLIAPIHHHFEHLGWDEVTVVIRFWIMAGLCVVAGLGIFYADWLD